MTDTETQGMVFRAMVKQISRIEGIQSHTRMQTAVLYAYKMKNITFKSFQELTDMLYAWQKTTKS